MGTMRKGQQELGIIPKGEPDDQLVTLQELAAEAHTLTKKSEASPADEPLQK